MREGKLWTWSEGGLRFERFPFVTGITLRPEQNRAPGQGFPLTLVLDRSKGCMAQAVDQDMRLRLEATYSEGSMLSTPVGESSVNKPLADEILGLLNEVTGGVAGKAFAEPGCGAGYLLRSLADAKALSVVGYEPGGQAEEGAARYEVPIERSFFHAQVTDRRFDCVYHYGVLEHVEDPEDFLRACLERLNTGGTLVALVPDCEEDMLLGNVSVLAHEHLNYFTRGALTDLFVGLGLKEIEARSLAYSKGTLAVWGRKVVDPPAGYAPSRARLEEERRLFETFAARLDQGLGRLLGRAARLAERGRTLGLYGVPSPLGALVSPIVAPRAFDGDERKHGGHFAGCASAVEPPRNLVSRPVDELWVLPVHHDAAIRKFLAGLLPADSKTEVVSVRELLEAQGD